MPDSFKTFRDPVLSLFQSAINEVAKRLDQQSIATMRGSGKTLPSRPGLALNSIAVEIVQRELGRTIGRNPTLSSPAARELSKAGIARVCAELSLRYITALAQGDATALSNLKDEFIAGTCDPAWLTTLTAYQNYFGSDGQRRPIPYIRPSAVGPKTIELKSNARVALVGDWGTGAQPAFDVLRLIANQKPDVFIHLGDIYYSGTPSECEANFVDPINQVLRNGAFKPDVFTVSGNHDMYCGGVGFYQIIKEINASASTQPASFFCLRTSDERWQILAMDTGLHDDNPLGVGEAVTFLEDDEISWHCERIKEFPGRTILLSHHQLFSAFSPIGEVAKCGVRSAVNPHLMEAFTQMNRSGKIAAWFWGHEHTLSIYKPFMGLERGRCVGHGAVPVSLVDKIYEALPDLDVSPDLVENTKLSNVGGVFSHGYALLQFDGGLCHAKYYENGSNGQSLLFTEAIS